MLFTTLVGNARIQHKGLYWFGRNVPTSSSSTRALALKFVVGVTNGRERERASQVSGRISVCACVCVWLFGRSIPFAWGNPRPFIVSGRIGGSDTKMMEKKKKRGGRMRSDPLPFILSVWVLLSPVAVILSHFPPLAVMTDGRT